MGAVGSGLGIAADAIGGKVGKALEWAANGLSLGRHAPDMVGLDGQPGTSSDRAIDIVLDVISTTVPYSTYVTAFASTAIAASEFVSDRIDEVNESLREGLRRDPEGFRKGVQGLFW